MVGPIKVLHVEDDLTEAGIIYDELNQYSKLNEIDLFHVSNLKDALNEIKSQGYEAVLLDIGLRELDGLDNVTAVREENPDLPIIVLTNSDNEALALEAIDSGAQEYLVKGHTNGKVIKFAISSSIRRKSLERKLFHQANYDFLTKLPNRGLLQEHLEKYIHMAKRWKADQAVMFLDINNFKYINDTYGHEAGNETLITLANRLKTTLRDTDIVARYGGDEFAIILDDKSEDKKKAAKFVAQKIVDAMKAPFVLSNGDAVRISISVGIAVYPADGHDANIILSAADAAMYQAKSQGPNSICMFTEDEHVLA